LERSKVIVWVLVIVAAGVIVWWVGFHGSQSGLPLMGLKAEPKTASASGSVQPKEPNSAPGGAGVAQDANQPKGAAPPAGGDPNKPAPAQPTEKAGAVPAKASGTSAEPNTPGPAARAAAARAAAARRGQARPPEGKPGETKPLASEPNQAKIEGDPNDPLEAVNLKDVEMKSIIEKIAQWTGKTVIPSDQAMTQKITIYAPEKMPRSRALLKIYSALRMKGFSPEVVEDTIFLKPLAEAKLGVHPVVAADQPLAAFENPAQIVQKFFKLANYPPAQMAQILQPLVGEYGHVSGDESTGTLLVIDSVGNLLRIQAIIAQFDVPDAGRMVTEFFEIRHGDPAEFVQLLRMLMGESADSRGRGGYSRGRPSFSSVSRPGGPPSGGPSGGPSKTATSVMVGTGEMPWLLIPLPKQKQIVARGSAEDVKQIGEWIAKLDRVDTPESECETVPIVYADTREVAQRIQTGLQGMPGNQIMPNVVIQPLEQSRQIMIFGRPDLRAMVKKLIAEADMPTGQFETEDFDLQHADPDQIKANIEGLYETQAGSMSSYRMGSYRFRNVQPSETVKVVSYPTMGKVTVIASAENMKKIREQIKDWDVALDVDEVKPRIIELKNSDPVQMAELLTSLFSEAGEDASRSFMRMLFYGDEMEQKKKIIGPLYGQLTFADVPGTKKIIVISKIPEAYDIIEQLILDLDRQEMAEVPRVVQLKYADPEDLAERLNAMFNEPGTLAPIRRSARGLGDYSMDAASSGGQGGGGGGQGPNAGGGGGGGSNPGEYTPWWSRGARSRLDEEPLSNVIGRVRFIPDPRSKSILVLSPPEFHNDIAQTIQQLDVPGMQVMIKATVMEVSHKALTSLGIQLATNPEAFGPLEENAIRALSGLTTLSTGGSAAPAPINPALPLGATGTGTIAGVTANVYVLIDFLVRHVNAKILNEQTLWTKDNEEASFFKGSTVAFLGDTQVTGTGISQSSFDFEEVGMTLAVRPSITPEKNVDMIVNIILSQLTADFVNGQPVRTKMDTKTNMIVADSETLMLGGILFQEKSRIKRKLPLLGDLPLVGGLFQHNDVSISNTEMIVFITPYVVSDGAQVSEKAKKQLDKSQQRLDEVQGELGAAAEALREKMDKE
jgi:general secretion pathway protein D